MAPAHQLLYDRITSLTPEKVGKVLSYLHFVEQEPDTVLFLDPEEETELHALLASGDFVDSSVVHAKIMELPNDKVS